MNERFERYNEITFEAYCKAAIDNAVHRGVRKKERRAELEPPLTELNDAVLFHLTRPTRRKKRCWKKP